MAKDGSINILYVDDEDNNLVAFQATFRRYFNVYTANSAKEAEVMLAEKDIHVLITDQRMPVKSGTELLAEAVKKYPKQVRILLTGYSDMEAIIDAVNRGQIFKHLEKPWDEKELKSAIEDAYDIFDRNKQQEQLILEYKSKLDKLNSDFKEKSDS